jgi:hypothetical protein
MISKIPPTMSGYPHPECITGGWTALLSVEEKKLVDAKVKEMKDIDGGFYYSYTGFDALDFETQQIIRIKLESNKRWERMRGTVRFRAPGPLDPRLLTLPDAKDVVQQKEWTGKFKCDAARELRSRGRQAARMAAADEFVVRHYVART